MRFDHRLLVHALISCLCLAPALAALQPDDDTPPAAPPPTVAAGQALMARGDYAGAAELLAAVVAAEPQNARAAYLLGYSLHALGRFAEALPVHERAARTPAFAATGGYNAACALARLGRVDEAFARLTAAIAAGFGDRKLLATDGDLEALRPDARFSSLLPPLLEGEAAFVEDVVLLRTLVGRAGNEEFGWVTRALGDLDGDGAIDFASTAPGHGGGAGRVDVVSSRSGELLFSRAGEPGWRLGNSVAGGADVDGDGIADVLVGAPNGGRALLLSGRDGSLLHELVGSPAEQFGLKVCLLDDLDEDGAAELVVTAWQAQGGTGRVSVYSGRAAAPLFTLAGGAPGELFGSGVDATHGATLVSPARADSSAPRLLAVGVSGAQRCDVFRCSASGAELLFSFRGEPSGKNLGQYFVSFLGDVDGDGVPDVYASDWNDSALTGRAFVHSGATGARLLDIPGAAPGEQFGTTAAVCGDVDGDGAADLLLGAWQSAAGAPAGGRCALHSGRDGRVLASWTSRQAGDTLGFDAVGLGDVDEDGSPDFVLSAAWSLVDQARQGRVFIVSLPRDG